MNLLDSFKNKTVLVIGDVMLDAYIWGKVARISPEAPVPVLDQEALEFRPGGAANVALNIAALGARALLVGRIGKDNAATKLASLLQQSGLDASGLIALPGKTTVKTRVIGNGHQLLRIDEEHFPELNDAEEHILMKAVLDIVEKNRPEAIIFEDYDKGTLSSNVIQSVIRLARKNGIFTAVDPKKKNFLQYREVDLFKPNLRELCDGLGLSSVPQSQNELSAAASKLRESTGAKAILVTLSERGIYYGSALEDFLFPAVQRRIADVSGAGDTVIATATLAAVSQFDARSLCWLANLAGGRVCESPGVVPISIDDLSEQVQIHPMPVLN